MDKSPKLGSPWIKRRQAWGLNKCPGCYTGADVALDYPTFGGRKIFKCCVLAVSAPYSRGHALLPMRAGNGGGKPICSRLLRSPTASIDSALHCCEAVPHCLKPRAGLVTGYLHAYSAHCRSGPFSFCTCLSTPPGYYVGWPVDPVPASNDSPFGYMDPIHWIPSRALWYPEGRNNTYLYAFTPNNIQATGWLLPAWRPCYIFTA